MSRNARFPSFNIERDIPFASQYTALLASNNQEGEKLTVSDSRLLDGRGQPYRDNDYVLYSISRNEFRNEGINFTILFHG